MLLMHCYSAFYCCFGCQRSCLDVYSDCAFFLDILCIFFFFCNATYKTTILLILVMIIELYIVIRAAIMLETANIGVQKVQKKKTHSISFSLATGVLTSS